MQIHKTQLSHSPISCVNLRIPSPNIIFWVVDWASTPEELGEGFCHSNITHKDWIMLILFFEEQQRPDEAKLCLQTAQLLL